MALGSPEAAERFSGEAQQAFEGGDYAKAAQLLTKAIAEDETDPELYANRGSCYDLLGKTDDALRDFDLSWTKAIVKKHDPKDKSLAGIAFNRGAALAHARRLKEAVADLTKALEIDPEFPEVRLDLGWILATASDASLRDPAKALAFLKEEAAENGGGSARLADSLAAAEAANGHFDEAVKQENAALELATTAQRRSYLQRRERYLHKKAYIDESGPALP